MVDLQTQIRVTAEGAGVTVKTLTTFLVLYYDTRIIRSHKLALLAFAVGQLAYSCTLLLVYVVSCGAALLSPK
jgi:oligosaccharide translocation protein RFT1